MSGSGIEKGFADAILAIFAHAHHERQKILRNLKDGEKEPQTQEEVMQQVTVHIEQTGHAITARTKEVLAALWNESLERVAEGNY